MSFKLVYGMSSQTRLVYFSTYTPKAVDMNRFLSIPSSCQISIGKRVIKDITEELDSAVASAGPDDLVITDPWMEGNGSIYSILL